MAVPAARYLVEFPQRGRGPHLPICDRVPPQPVPGFQEPDLQELIAEAEARGRAEGEAAAHLQLEQRMTAERSAFEERVAAERRGWVAEQADVLSRELHSALVSLSERVSASIGRALAPFLAESLRRKAVDDLAERIEALLAGQAGATIKVTGPEDLLDALRARLSDRTPMIEFLPGGAELRVTFEAMRIETELEAWGARLREAVG
jgi:hypothetical protein